MNSCTFLKLFDMFKVQQTFYLYQDQKSRGKKKYTKFYGSYLGSLLTIIAFTIGLSYLISLTFEMISGQFDGNEIM